ncbi:MULTISPECIES: sporulation membrane protein YtaF [Oceanobacillus]|uniref:Manganese efflux pump MntP n=2 Tax=Oceanobacillus TaxID=182709 RepID=A0A0A1MMU1_9BACI|nr:sporulation membrane protein YtaF [Oceanobacillus oncorhynchi]MDM8098835.1 sporulation membrane protein YtaF [Oceanobacillus oncorhynchi]CEI81134.1 manganese efflux pump MntP [Oceanobacillus oncorhynchi]
MIYTGMLLLVIAVSLDGFSVGITYGMRQIKVPLLSLFVIMFCSGLIVFLSMEVGDFLRSFISPQGASMLGGGILIFLGVFSLISMFRSRETEAAKNGDHASSNVKFENMKTVLTRPKEADLDKSGIISINESILLGFALALDAFGAGIGAAMLGYSPLITALLTAGMSGLFLFSGIMFGSYLWRIPALQRLSFLPSVFLITLGCWNIFSGS